MRSPILLILFPLIIFSQVREEASHRYVAFTFDDLPSTHDVNAKYIIEHLTDAGYDLRDPADMEDTDGD